MSIYPEALRSYAAMFNDLEHRHLERHLADDFCYSSQMVFDEIKGKSEYLTYIETKLNAIKKSGAGVFAELAISGSGNEPNCLVMSQGKIENLVATLFVEMREDLIIRADMCVVPSPLDVRRTGIYPRVGG
jgi:hypothetical protein